MENLSYQKELLYPKILWQRPVHKYKSSAGRVMVLAGSKNMSGVAMLACEAVFRSGSGILLLGFPESLRDIYRGVLPEAMTLELPETPGHTLAKKADILILEQSGSCDVIVVGPGLSENAETVQLIWELIFSSRIPVVLCDDGIKAYIQGINVLLTKKDNVFTKEYLLDKLADTILVITESEANKLWKVLKLDKGILNTSNDNMRIEMVKTLASACASTVVLMGTETIMTTREGETIVTRLPGPSVALNDTRGVIASIIGSFMAQNKGKPAEAIATAIYLHELAASLLREETKKETATASDVLRYLQKAIKKAEE